jgi:hypothetical protein
MYFLNYSFFSSFIKNFKIKSILFYFIIILIINSIFYYEYIKRFPYDVNIYGDIQFNRLAFFFGPLLDNFINNNQYVQYIFDKEFFLSRMPLIPIFIKYVYLILTKKLFFLIFIKNLLFFSLIIYLLYKILKKDFLVLVAFCLIIYNPFNLATSLTIIPEEGYLSFFFIIFFLVYNYYNFNRILLFSILLFLIFFTKASLVYFCYIFSILIFSTEKNNNKLFNAIPLLAVITAYLIWATYAYSKLNKIISPISVSSISGFTIQVAYNKEFNLIYPLQSPDILLDEIFEKNLNKIKESKDELEINSIFFGNSINFIINNKTDVFFSFIKKLNLLFFNIKYDAKNMLDENYDRIRYSDIPNKIALIGTVLLIFYKIFIKKKYLRAEIFLIFFFITYLFPYIAAFLYTRHLVPIFIICHLYLYFEFLKYYKKFK